MTSVSSMSTEELRLELKRLAVVANKRAYRLEKSGIKGLTGKHSVYAKYQLQLEDMGRSTLPTTAQQINKLSQGELRHYITIGRQFTNAKTSTIAGYNKIRKAQEDTLMRNYPGLTRKGAKLFGDLMDIFPDRQGYTEEAIDFVKYALEKGVSPEEIAEAYTKSYDTMDDYWNINQGYKNLGLVRPL